VKFEVLPISALGIDPYRYSPSVRLTKFLPAGAADSDVEKVKIVQGADRNCPVVGKGDGNIPPLGQIAVDSWRGGGEPAPKRTVVATRGEEEEEQRQSPRGVLYHCAHRQPGVFKW
jgi:hypothetical protein